MMTDDQDRRLHEARQYWDAAAVSFDNEPDHGLRDPSVRQAWTAQFARWLPATGLDIVDIGCGTGTLSVLLAGLGHTITGLDISPAMLDLAAAKARAAGQHIVFQVGDATDPQRTLTPLVRPGFDAVVCRHVLWALPDLGTVLRRWAQLLRPDGRLLLIEGFWHTGGGLHAPEIVAMLPPSMTRIVVHDLSTQPELWGGPVADERYAVLTDRLDDHGR